MSRVYVSETSKYKEKGGRRVRVNYQGTFTLKDSFVEKELSMDLKRIKKRKFFKRLNIGYYYGKTKNELETDKMRVKIEVIKDLRVYPRPQT